MANRVLILGGRGRIGNSVAIDLLTHTSAHVTITGRNSVAPLGAMPGQNVDYLALDLSNEQGLATAIASTDLVIHCAGPFRQRNTQVLQSCIEQGVNYLDVSDDRAFTQAALSHQAAAKAANVTAIVNTGVFPGISNSMVRQGIEQLDTADYIHLSYVVAGSGGSGVTVMRTTFLGLQNPFKVWLDRQWQTVKPYTGRETVEFPQPFGKTGVYWFDMPEALTLTESFPVATVIVKFGSTPDFYNYLTAIVANVFPRAWVHQSQVVEFLSQVSYRMTSVTNRFSGIGVAMRAEIRGYKAGQPVRYVSTFVQSDTAAAVGYGTGSVAQLMLSGQLNSPGVWAVEQALPTDLFQQTMQQRGVTIAEQWL
ncbi:MAG: saccharopine dehydrogenase NADP-binding domain-containing protein [Drouetiella hepatica Uher 2000/2452]|jgi:saccharopine dehydrogenase-like NADP-dependent oxidoreductase|uniref:Saccharopine dehydrogenase NADP-binding domain-containing protein n=1 Tax=Drouetiella hepatica Uher 2000/2452 TaxID=904376 RepID=A0A951UM38_9CYAN|nr:saccharopine dehydrogenase NADP-binding domain-containing protein [Drouetiella hepatica Uher 2000/2452]